jgi:hypothetical protein
MNDVEVFSLCSALHRHATTHTTCGREIGFDLSLILTGSLNSFLLTTKGRKPIEVGHVVLFKDPFPLLDVLLVEDRVPGLVSLHTSQLRLQILFERFAGDLTDLGVEIQIDDFRRGNTKPTSDHLQKQAAFAVEADFSAPFSVEKYVE